MSARSVHQHYQQFLAKHYSWMFGDFKQEIENNRRWFENHKIYPQSNRKAIDFGCGSGFQSLALSSLGFEVTAVDFNRDLLEELKTHDRENTINVVHSDILNPEKYKDKGPFELAVCMGDTLPHLPTLSSISDFFLSVYDTLRADGKFVLSFRDYSVELTGSDRFIPVHNDRDKIMTVFLEYDLDYVYVHDLVYEQKEDSWEFEKSVYKKVRLSADQVRNLLEQTNFSIHDLQSNKGMVHVTAAK